MRDRIARRKSGAELEDARQGAYPLVPGLDGGEFRPQLLSFRRQAEGEQRRQQEEIGHGERVADEERPSVAQLVLHHLQRSRRAGERMGHDLLVGLYPELLEHQPLVADVIDHVGIEIGVEIADPLIHPRPLARIARGELRPCEDLIRIGRDGAGFVQHEIAVLQHRHPAERVPGEMRRAVHLVFRVVEREVDALLGEDEADDVHEGAALKAEHDDWSHVVSPIPVRSEVGVAEVG